MLEKNGAKKKKHEERKREYRVLCEFFLAFEATACTRKQSSPMIDYCSKGIRLQ